MSAAEERARQVLAALGNTSPEGIRAAAARLPPELAALLEGVADALGAPDPAAALAAALGPPEDGPPDAQSRRATEAAAALIGPQLAQILEMAAGAEAAVAAFAEALPKGVEVPSDVPADVAAVLKRALDAASDAAPIQAVQSALAETRNLTLVIGDLVEGARRDPTRAATSMPALDARVRALERTLADVSRVSARMPDGAALAAEVRALAEQRGDLLAVAQLSLVEAGFLERLHGMADPRVIGAWDAVFDAAVRAAQLPLARAAAQRLQLVAVDRGAFARVAVLAHRSADLAAQVGDLRAEVLSRGEEALALARIAEHREDALRIAADAVERAAGGPAALQARARLARGQVLETLGQDAEARAIFRRILEDARADTSFAREVAFAALHLGRLELPTQPHSGTRTLDFARELGRRGGEWRIYGPAARALLEHHLLAGDRFRVGVLLRELVVEAPRLGGEPGRAVLAEIRAELDRRWGAAAVDALLAAP